jgi:hypothetical protein
MQSERSGDLPPPSTSCRTVHRANVLKTGFTGIWSVTTSNTAGPASRTGHFTVYDPANHAAYIGYGITSTGTHLSDLWPLDTLTLRWTNIPLYGEILSGRSGTRAALIGAHLVLFGGYSAPMYFGDLHTINIETGHVKVVLASGEAPTPRSTPVVAVYGGKLYVWGGFNGDWPAELNVLTFDTMTWQVFAQDVAGRTAVPWVIFENFLYSFGGSKSAGMLVLNLDTFAISIRPTTGAEPPSAVMGAGMVRVGKYGFFYGGKADTNATLMYACDLTTFWWFVFHVTADGETVSVADGTVSELGLFMLPRIHSFSMCYVKENRQIMAFLGSPEKDPPPLSFVAIGEAMAIINLRDDLVSLLRSSVPPVLST